MMLYYARVKINGHSGNFTEKLVYSSSNQLAFLVLFHCNNEVLVVICSTKKILEQNITSP